jgi:EpsG family
MTSLAAAQPMTSATLRASVPLRVALYVLGALLAACIPGFVLLGPSPDLENYRILYEDWNFIDLAEHLQGNDPVFFALSKLTYEAGTGFAGFLLVMALLTCSLQARLLWLLDTQRGLLLALYASYLFWLHDYTQIRFSLALVFVMLGMYEPQQHTLRRWLLFALGLGVHASTALLVLLWALWRYPRAALALLAAGVPLLVASGQLDNTIVAIALRLATYVEQRDLGLFDTLNIFSLMPLTQALITLLCMQGPPLAQRSALERQEIAFAWAGFASFYIFSFLPVLAFRTYEMMIPFFLILLSRNWKRSWAIRAVGLVYVLLGLRVSFLTADSVLPLL